MRDFIIGAIAGLVLGLVVADLTDDPGAPVCHSVTEDSIITDCDYRDGAWYPKGDR